MQTLPRDANYWGCADGQVQFARSRACTLPPTRRIKHESGTENKMPVIDSGVFISVDRTSRKSSFDKIYSRLRGEEKSDGNVADAFFREAGILRAK